MAGTRNLTAKAFAALILEQPGYLERLKERARNGTLPSAIENTLLYWYKGKPAETVNLGDNTATALHEASEDQLEARAQAIVVEIRERKARVASEAAEAARRAREVDTSLATPDPLDLEGNVVQFPTRLH